MSFRAGRGITALLVRCTSWSPDMYAYPNERTDRLSLGAADPHSYTTSNRSQCQTQLSKERRGGGADTPATPLNLRAPALVYSSIDPDQVSRCGPLSSTLGFTARDIRGPNPALSLLQWFAPLPGDHTPTCFRFRSGHHSPRRSLFLSHLPSSSSADSLVAGAE